MARIAGVDLPREKRIEIGLTYIYGIGRALARRILQTTGVNADQRIRDLSDADTNKLRQAIEKDFRVEGARDKQSGRYHQWLGDGGVLDFVGASGGAERYEVKVGRLGHCLDSFGYRRQFQPWGEHAGFLSALSGCEKCNHP